jgi:hypothetical protein
MNKKKVNNKYNYIILNLYLKCYILFFLIIIKKKFTYKIYLFITVIIFSIHIFKKM